MDSSLQLAQMMLQTNRDACQQLYFVTRVNPNTDLQQAPQKSESTKIPKEIKLDIRKKS